MTGDPVSRTREPPPGLRRRAECRGRHEADNEEAAAANAAKRVPSENAWRAASSYAAVAGILPESRDRAARGIDDGRLTT